MVDPSTPTRLTREQSRAVTRDRLLDAAARVFARKGVAAASLEEIAEAAGYTRGAVYSNFADKDDLFLAVMDRRSEWRIAEFTERLGRDTDPLALLGVARAGNAERWDDPGNWHLLSTELALHAARNPHLRPALAERERTYVEAIGRAVRLVFEQLGVEPPMALDDIAQVVHALDRGLILAHLIDPERVAPDLYVNALGVLMSLAARG